LIDLKKLKDINLEMKIKRINGRYIKSLYRLGEHQFKKEFWFTKKFLKDAIKRKGIYYGAFEGKNLVGAIFVDINDRPKAWLFFFDVKENYRNQGVGKKLLEVIERKLPKDYYEIFTDCEKADKLAIKFYKKHGFKKQGKIKDWFGKGTWGIIYSKTIKEK